MIDKRDNMDLTLFNKMYNEYKPVQNNEELSWLIQHAEKTSPKVIVEIGTEYGGTFKMWEQILPKGGLLIGVDIEDKLRWNIKNSDRDVHMIIGDSKNPDTINRVTNILKGNKIDFLFIDGDHDYYSVKADYENYERYVRSRGIIGFHDIYMQAKDGPININDGHHGSVTRFWKEVVAYKDELQSKTGSNPGTGIITKC